MIFFKNKCKKCEGTGVSEVYSYNVGAGWFFTGIELIIPLITIIIPLYVIFWLDLGTLSVTYLWRIIVILFIIAFIIIWMFISRFIKKLIFGQCLDCGGSGRGEPRN